MESYRIPLESNGFWESKGAPLGLWSIGWVEHWQAQGDSLERAAPAASNRALRSGITPLPVHLRTLSCSAKLEAVPYHTVPYHKSPKYFGFLKNLIYENDHPEFTFSRFPTWGAGGIIVIIITTIYLLFYILLSCDFVAVNAHFLKGYR